MKDWNLIKSYIEFDKKENSNRPKREHFNDKKEYRRAADKYNMEKTLGKDGIISYFEKRAEELPEDLRNFTYQTISALKNLRDEPGGFHPPRAIQEACLVF